MRKGVKILTVIVAFSLIVTLLSVFSEYSFVVALVDNSTASDIKPVLRNSIVVVRKISLSKNIVGKRICFWRILSYFEGNIRIDKRVLGIGTVTNPDPTVMGTEVESDEPLRERTRLIVHWNNVTGELVAILNVP